MVDPGRRRVYVDASALVKLVVTEDESAALTAYLAAQGPQVSSRIVTVEVLRAVRRANLTLAGRAEGVIEVVDHVEVDSEVAHAAARLEPANLRALDALHVASALALGTEISAFITYDARLADAARAAGLTVVAPA